MSFTRPEILLLLWGVPILGIVFWRAMRRRRRILSAFASPKNLAVLSPGESWRLEGVRRALLLAALACLALALAGARLGYVWETVPRREASLMLVLDVSKSMLAGDMVPDRLQRAKREIRDLLDRLGGERAGLVAFAGTAYMACPLTVDYAAFDLFLTALTPDNLPVGGTDLAGAVEAALSGFDPKDPAHKSIVLFSDGEGADPQQAEKEAEKAAAMGVRIFAIGLGEKEGAPIPEPDGSFKKDEAGEIVMTRRGDDLLRRLAELTGGAYAVSTPGDEDVDFLLSKGLGEGLASKAAGETRIQIFKDRFQWFLGAAILFLSLEMFLPVLAKRRSTGSLLAALAFAAAALGPGHAVAGAAGEADKGMAAYEAGRFDAARERFLTAQALAPESSRAAYDAGCAAYRLGRFEEAKKLFEQAARLAEGRGKPDDALKNVRRSSLYNQGNALFRAEDLEGAIKAYEAALSVDPDDPRAKANLEYVKKLLEQRKNDQKQQNDQDKNSENGKKENKDGGQGENDKKQPQNDGQKGDRGPEKNGAGDGPEKKEEPQSQAGENPQEQAPREQPDARNAPANDGEKDRAQNENAPSGIDETMLNRLKDSPGMPKPPRYGRPPVTKDW